MRQVTGRLARAALAGLFVMASAASAVQPAPPCLQQREAEDLVVFVLPALTDAMARKCTPLLPGSATLSRSGSSLAARYRPDSNAAWPNARLAFNKLSGGDTLNFLSDEVNRKIIEEASSAAIVADFKAKDCAMIDRFIGALSPLPARNVAQLVALFMEIGEKEGKSPMNICPSESAR
jgi:hypothetical protein